MRRFSVWAILAALLLLSTTTASATDRPPISRPYIGGTGDQVALCQSPIVNSLPTSTVSTVGGACFATQQNDVRVKITLADDSGLPISGMAWLGATYDTFFVGIPLCSRDTTFDLLPGWQAKYVIVQLDEVNAVRKGVDGTCPQHWPATRGTITAVFSYPPL